MYARQLKRRAEPALTWWWGVEGHSSCLKWRKPASQSLELWNGDPSRFVVVLELSMTAFSSNFKPTISNQLYNHAYDVNENRSGRR